jgi:hypothetical protein
MIEKPCRVSIGNHLYYTFVKKPTIEAILVNVVTIHLDFGGASSCLRVGQIASNNSNTRWMIYDTNTPSFEIRTKMLAPAHHLYHLTPKVADMLIHFRKTSNKSPQELCIFSAGTLDGR